MKQVKRQLTLSIERTPRPEIAKEDHRKPRKLNLMAVTLAALALVLGTATAHAQTQKAIASIPFDFQVGARHMSAGRYAVDTSDGYLLTIRGLSTSGEAFVLSNSIDSKHREQEDSPRLVFLRVGSQYYLAQVWTPDLQDGRKIPVPKNLQIEAGNDAGQKTTIAMLTH
jgi:hypothetical protein